MHRILARQLKKMALTNESSPNAEQWQKMLSIISSTYDAADDDRYLLERSLKLSSAETEALYTRQKASIEGRLDAILHAHPDLLFLINAEGRYLEILAADHSLLYCPENELKGQLIEDMLPTETALSFLRCINDALISNELQLLNYDLVTPSGDTTFEARIMSTGLKVDGQGTVIIIARDISLQVESQKKERLLDTVISAATEGVAIISKTRQVLYANKAVGDITGYNSDELMQSGEGFLRNELDASACDLICAEAGRVNKYNNEIEIHTKSNELRTVWLNVDTLRSESNEIDFYVALLTDVTDLQQSRAQLEHVATHDALTSLPNRVLFEQRLEQAISRGSRQERQGALLLLDLDRFKQVNDSLGHSVGDSLLIEVADRLKQVCRMEDTVARFGGDEFTILLEDLENQEHAAKVARKILVAFSKPIIIDELSLDIGTSIGISIFPDEKSSITSESLMKQADAAMYAVKDSGGGQYSFYTSDMSELALRNISMQSALKAALNNNELSVVYQPQVYLLSNNKLAGMEVLVRWPQADGGIVMPVDFIPVAELSGLIEQLGLWVLDESCRQANIWQTQGLEFGRLSVNVSGRQLANPHFAKHVQKVLNKYHLDGSAIELEITESMVIHEGGARFKNLNALHLMGLGLAIDDFGTGHSSLVNLKRFPFARLKIDRSFISDIGHDKNDETIVAATIALAKSLDLELVAEGVETHQQEAFLKALECDIAQGFLYAEGLSADAITQKYADHTD